MPQKVSYSKQFIFGIILLLIIGIVVEVIFQIIWLDMQDTCKWKQNEALQHLPEKTLENLCDDYNSLKYDIGVIRQLEPNQHLNTFNINSLGFRGIDFDLPKPDDEYRIFMVGGSTTFGMGTLNDESTIPGQLNDIFKNEFPNNKKINVINAGIVAARSIDERYLVEKVLVNYEPDMIFVLDGYNDAFNIAMKDHQEGDEFSMFENQHPLQPFIRENLKFLATPNVIFQLTYDYNQANYLTSEVMSKNTEAWVDRWNAVCELGKKSDFNLIVSVQPMVGTSDRDMTSVEQKKSEGIREVKSRELMNDLANNLEKINCDTVDLRSSFDGINEPVYITHVHTGSFGNKILAEKIYEKISPIILNENLSNENKFNLKFIKNIGYFESQDIRLNNPHGMDFHNKKLFVLDTSSNQILILDDKLNFLSKLNINTEAPQGIAVTNEKIFVADTYQYQIKSFDYNGNILNEFPVSWTRDLEADENFIYVMEPHQNSIKVYDHSGEQVQQFDAHRNLHYLNSNNEYLIASGAHPSLNQSIPPEILIFDKQTGILEKRFPYDVKGVSMFENNLFAIKDDMVIIFNHNGNHLHEQLLKNNHNSLFTQIEQDNDKLYILDTGGSSIQVFQMIYE